MKCGQGKPYKSYAMGGVVTKQASIPSYQKGGVVKRPEPGMYTAEMGPPPTDIDNLSSLPAAQRKPAERKAQAQMRKDSASRMKK